MFKSESIIGGDFRDYFPLVPRMSNVKEERQEVAVEIVANLNPGRPDSLSAGGSASC